MSIANSTTKKASRREKTHTGKPAPDPRVSELIGWTEASIRYGVSLWRLRNAATRDELEVVHVPGGKRLLRRQAVEAWIAKNPDKVGA